MRALAPCRRVLVAVLAVSTAACIGPRTPAPTRSAPTIPETVRVKTGGRIVTVPFESYVLGSALSEVSPVGESPDAAARIFAVQAIVARTYALAHLGRHREEGFDLCDTTHCQLYEPARIRTSRFADLARRAVESTRHTILLYDGRPADAVYHADCGGHTASADAVWGGRPVAYLTGADDDVPAAAHRTWEYAVSAARLQAVLGDDARTRTGGRLQRITIATRDASGRADTVEIRGQRAATVSATLFRAILARAFGERSIMSTRFSLAQQGPEYRFTGTGFGHGVGLCQIGAAARARRGTPAEMIFAAYFPGTRLTAIGTSGRAATDGPLPFPGLVRSP
ncbi:MAG: SpoIID/LytB domain-containing protein [Acidobacteria bacterium]|nr:SpoIID/LytB domain-containing protein [Acidobacteriota bacterium]